MFNRHSFPSPRQNPVAASWLSSNRATSSNRSLDSSFPLTRDETQCNPAARTGQLPSAARGSAPRASRSLRRRCSCRAARWRMALEASSRGRARRTSGSSDSSASALFRKPTAFFKAPRFSHDLIRTSSGAGSPGSAVCQASAAASAAFGPASRRDHSSQRRKFRGCGSVAQARRKSLSGWTKVRSGGPGIGAARRICAGWSS
jgi:hypothetical protein